MKRMISFLFLLGVLLGCSAQDQAGALQEAASRVAAGKAVLVDVREPAEWADTGVAAPAVLLSKGSFEAGSVEWKKFLDQNRGKEIILMCRSGNRSGQVAKALGQQGLKTTNLGAFSAWKAAGLPTRKVP